MNRGDVVMVDFSLYDPNDKVRPALVVQNDRDNARMAKTIVALITSTVRREDTQVLLDRSHPDFAPSGLHRDSAVNCSNLYTIRQSDISQTSQFPKRRQVLLELGNIIVNRDALAGKEMLKLKPRHSGQSRRLRERQFFFSNRATANA